MEYLKPIIYTNAQKRRELLNKYRFDKNVGSILIISHTAAYSARASYFVKSEGCDAWRLLFESEAVIGKNGMNKAAEGDGKTPCGDYAITGAFGICPKPDTALDYIKLSKTSLACNEHCEYYNRIIDTEKNYSGEQMYYCSPEYNYGLISDYNSACVYPAGSAIFIHCKGFMPYTEGCAALSEKDMLTILKTASAGMRVYFDEY